MGKPQREEQGGRSMVRASVWKWAEGDSMGALHCLSKRPRGPTKEMELGHSQHGCPTGRDCHEAPDQGQNNLLQRKGEGRHFALGGVVAGALGLRQAGLLSPSSALCCLWGIIAPPGPHTPTCGMGMTPTSQGRMRVTPTEMRAPSTGSRFCISACPSHAGSTLGHLCQAR